MKKALKIGLLTCLLLLACVLLLTSCFKHEHKFELVETINPASCYMLGDGLYRCKCGEEKLDVIPTTPHTLDKGVVLTEATCAVEGEKYFTCTVKGCRHYEVQKIEKTKHKYIDGKWMDYTETEEATFCLTCQDFPLPNNDDDSVCNYIRTKAKYLKLSSDKKTLLGVDSSFKGDKLYVPNTVTKIAENAFRNNNTITTVVLPDSVTVIENYAFFNNNRLEIVVIGSESKLEKIGDGAFSDCLKLKKIALPESVKVIGQKAFRGCESLVEIVLENKIESIGKEAFYLSSNLETIAFIGTNEQWEAIEKGENWNVTSIDGSTTPKFELRTK